MPFKKFSNNLPVSLKSNQIKSHDSMESCSEVDKNQGDYKKQQIFTFR